MKYVQWLITVEQYSIRTDQHTLYLNACNNVLMCHIFNTRLSIDKVYKKRIYWQKIIVTFLKWHLCHGMSDSLLVAQDTLSQEILKFNLPMMNSRVQERSLWVVFDLTLTSFQKRITRLCSLTFDGRIEKCEVLLVVVVALLCK